MLGSLFLASFLSSFSLVLAQAPGTPAEIYRCTDGDGNVTYQQSKCPASGKSSRVDTQENGRTYDPPAREAEWAKAAQENRVQNGMPRRWVRAALGTPSQMHLGSDEGASETWDYDSAAGLLRVGFRDGNVLWTRDRRTVKLSPTVGSDAASPIGAASSSGEAAASSPATRPTVKLSPAPGSDGASAADSMRSSTDILASAPIALSGTSAAAAAAGLSASAAGSGTAASLGMTPRGDAPVAGPISPTPIAAAPVTPGTAGAPMPIAAAPATSGTQLSSATPLVDPARRAERRQAVALGNDCDAVRRDLGAADQDNGLGAPSPLAVLRGGAAESRDLVYEPAPGDPGVRTRIRCMGGKVTAVERSNVP